MSAPDLSSFDLAPSLKNEEPAAAYPRQIRSFVKRAGRITQGQTKAIHDLSPLYTLASQSTHVNWDEVFKRSAPKILEIGFGMGESTAHIAHIRPDVDFIACEVHEPGIGALLMRIKEKQLSNLRIVPDDANLVIKHMLPNESLAGVHIFFPDPWHKKRHHKRRLIQKAWVQSLLPCLAPDALIHCATDWQDYAEQMLDVFSSFSELINTSPYAHGYADKPFYRPTTKFEKRGLDRGHRVWDLIFRKAA